MAQVRQILKHVWVEQAKGNRRCRRNRSHTIPPGDACLVIRDDSGPFTKNYCMECAEPILGKCAANLRSIGRQLYPSRFGELVPANEDTVEQSQVYANEDDYLQHDAEVVEVLVRTDRRVGQGQSLAEAAAEEGLSEEEVRAWQQEVGLLDQAIQPLPNGVQLDAFRLEGKPR